MIDTSNNFTSHIILCLDNNSLKGPYRHDQQGMESEC